MKHHVIYIGFGAIAILLAALPSGLWPQAIQEKNQAREEGIEGTWTLLSWENEGRLQSFLPRPALPFLGTGNVAVGAYLWKISKDEIQMGADAPELPRHRYTYELHPGKVAGKIDLITLDKNGKKLSKEKQLGIYLLKDDILFICSSWSPEERPESFTTSEKPPTRNLNILRRGKLK